MTREEARREIDSLDFYLQNHTDDYGEESHTAMMMAIEALEHEPCEDAVSRQAAIDTEGLDEQIKCEMCRNPMHTVRGCDGNCKYDEKLYERIMQILDERIKPLPSAQPEIIYCKKCKHWTRTCGDEQWSLGDCDVFDKHLVMCNGYCAWAEGREE